MKVLIAADSSLLRTPDGKYWSKTIYSYDFFARYFSAFEQIVVASRTEHVDFSYTRGFLRVDGPNVSICELPNMHGIKDYIFRFFSFFKAANIAAKNGDCAIFRLPSIPSSLVLHCFKKQKKPYALEIVADPQDAYSTNKFAKTFFSRHMKKACLQANGVSYVTKDYLQKLYPSYAHKYGATDQHFFAFYSTIRLNSEFFSAPKLYFGKKSFSIIHTANNMNNLLKGHDVLIQVVSQILKDGYDVSLVFVGDGKLRGYLEKLASQLFISDKVIFLGTLNESSAVRAELLKADILVFPTKAEGLPRTIIEAMAVGLPCISSPIAGIPELLESEDMIPPNDIVSLVKRVESLLDNPSIMERKSARNIQIAQEYCEDVLSKRRKAFYQKLRNLAQGG